MKQIPLTQGKVALVDDADYAWLSQWKWYYMKGRNTGYAIRRNQPNRKPILMHRVIMDTPTGIEVDHVDHDGCNNQKYNLRNCTPHQNSQSQSKHKNNTSGYKGVVYNTNDGKWDAQIRVNGLHIHLGHFASPEIAAQAYDKAAQKYFGEFAYPNFAEVGHGNSI